MKSLYAICLLLIASCVFTHATFADESPLNNVRKLRREGKFDNALAVLDRLEKRKGTATTIRSLISLERALTLFESQKSVADAEEKRKLLEQTLVLLKQFAKKNPRHERSGEANAILGQILLSQAHAENWKSRSLAKKDERAKLQDRARDLLAEAREALESAHDQYVVAWRAFPKFIDKRAQPKQYAQRKEAEIGYMRVQYNLAQCAYEEARSYDRKSDESIEGMRAAATAFEEVYSKYRTQVVGLFARIWQGKCFEESGDLRTSMGIYNEVLNHPGKSGILRVLGDQAQQFRLVLLNHESRRDYDLVIVEGEKWIAQNNAPKHVSEVGLGIRWEIIAAQQAKATAAETDLAEPERQRLLEQALANAHFISRIPGPYKEFAKLKILELSKSLQ